MIKTEFRRFKDRADAKTFSIVIECDSAPAKSPRHRSGILMMLFPIFLVSMIREQKAYVVEASQCLGSKTEQNGAIRTWILWHSNLDGAPPPMCYFDCVAFVRCLLSRPVLGAYKKIFMILFRLQCCSYRNKMDDISPTVDVLWSWQL